MTEREFATEVVRILREAGFEALFAGGCVRDQLLGREPDDFDVATNARPEAVQKLFRRTIAVGVSFGVVEVLGPRPLKVQVATFRSDGTYSDGRRPDSVVFCSAIEDAERRDFTINGMFFDPLDEKVIDYVGGERDLRQGIVRAIGQPQDRFREDKLRLLRAVRFATRFGFGLDTATQAAIHSMAHEVVTVSAERIAEELRKLLSDPRRTEGVKLLQSVELLRPVLPEADSRAASKGAWRLTLEVLASLPADASFELALAALLRKQPLTEIQKAENRLRLANVERDRIEWLAKHHDALRSAPSLPLSRLKPLLAHAGIRELLALHRAESLAAGESTAHVEFCEERLELWPMEELDPPPLITGADLISLGLKPGPNFKRILCAVRDAQLDGMIGSADEGLAMVHRLQSEDG